MTSAVGSVALVTLMLAPAEAARLVSAGGLGVLTVATAAIAWLLRRRGAAATAAASDAAAQRTRHLDLLREKNAALEEAYARFEAVMEGMQDAIWDFHVASHEIYISGRLREILGYAADDLESVPNDLGAWRSRVHPDDLEFVFFAVERCIAGGPPVDVEYRIRHADGHYVEVRSRGRMRRNAAGEPYRLSGVLTDVSAVNERQRMLEATKRDALAVARAKADFLANMSHELRTPMNGVLGMLQLLRDTPLNRAQRHQVELASTSAEGLLGVINDVLDVSKIEAGKLSIETVEFDLRALLSSVAEGLAHTAQSKGLEVVLDMHAVDAEQVVGDPVRIRQVLTNLMSNAMKFTERGEIELRAAIDADGSGALRFHATVRDTGIGIPEDRHAALFEAFTQADSSTTRLYGGTGLGLTITRRLCELMGGGISVESEVGVGSTFSVELALLPSAEPSPLRPLREGAAPRVLAVIPHVSTRQALARQLSALGADVRGVAALPEGATDAEILIVDAASRPEPEALRKRHQARLALLAPLAEECAEDVGEGFEAVLTKPFGLTSIARVRELLSETGRVSKAPTATAPRFQGSRVLLVEDNPVNQAVARGLLGKLGIEVEVAGDGQDALERLGQDAGFDLVLMDCQMPRLDGYAATRAIRAGDAGDTARGLPIVAMTANALDGDRERCLAAGMDDYLSKPVRLPELVEVIAERLGPPSQAHSVL